MRDSPCEDVLDSPATVPENPYVLVVRRRARWEPQEEGMMSTTASFSQL